MDADDFQDANPGSSEDPPQNDRDDTCVETDDTPSGGLRLQPITKENKKTGQGSKKTKKR